MDFKKRFYVIVAILAVYVCFIGYKSYQTVITDGAKYRAKVERLKVDSVSIPQLRGFIFADGNELLAGSLPEYDVFLDFKSTTVPDSNRTTANTLFFSNSCLTCSIYLTDEFSK